MSSRHYNVNRLIAHTKFNGSFCMQVCDRISGYTAVVLIHESRVRKVKSSGPCCSSIDSINREDAAQLAYCASIQAEHAGSDESQRCTCCPMQGFRWTPCAGRTEDSNSSRVVWITVRHTFDDNHRIESSHMLYQSSMAELLSCIPRS